MADKKLFNDFPPHQYKDWLEKTKKELKGADIEQLQLRSDTEGIVVKALYTKQDLEKLAHFQNTDVAALLNKTENNDWVIHENIEVGDAGAANQIAVKAVQGGANALGFQLKEVNAPVLNDLLEKIPLQTTRIDWQVPDPLKFTETLSKYAKREQVNYCALKYDPIIEGLKSDDLKSAAKQLEGIGQLIEKLSSFENFKLITVNAAFIHNAGSNTIQELAAALALGNEYLVRLTNAGLSIDEAVQKLQFHFASGSDYFVEIAKFRAFRLLWAKIVQQYQPGEEASLRTWVHASTSSREQSRQDQYNNLLRGDTQAMAAAIGGCDSIVVLPFNQAKEMPSDFSRRMARNTQLIIKEEARLDKVIDPAAGSYYIEAMTDFLAKQAWDKFKEIEARGGFLESAKDGWLLEEIKKTARLKMEEVKSGERVMVGVNKYHSSDEKDVKFDGETTKGKLKEVRWADVIKAPASR